jgi:hypothetical protein
MLKSDFPSYQTQAHIFTGKAPLHARWIDSAIFIHQVDSKNANPFTYSEQFLGPLASALRYIKDDIIPPEFATDPQIVLSSSDFTDETASPWVLELRALIMKYAGLTKPTILPASLVQTLLASDEEEDGVAQEPSQWLCARKVIIPGHTSTPFPGKPFATATVPLNHTQQLAC